MHLALWIVAGLLGAVYLLAGVGKLVVPKEKLATAPGGGWVNDFSPAAIRAIGAFEILGAAGLVLPAALDIAPGLVPVAATGLATIMAGAVIIRIRRSERGPMLADLAYLALVSFVAWGRFGPEAFS